MDKNIWGKSSLLTKTVQASLALGALTMASAAVAVPGDTAIFSFDLPATALPSQTPPYPVIATLTLVEDANGVVFTLDPNEDNPGFTDTTPTDPNDSRIERLDIAFVLAPTTPPINWSNVSGALVESIELETNQNNFDSGYSATAQHLVINFFNPVGNCNTGCDSRFNVGETSTWRIDQTTVAQFATAEATSGPKPSPIFGVISVAPFSNPDLQPNTSNWVAEAGTPTMVPEPTNLALLGIGLIGFAVVRRRQVRL